MLLRYRLFADALPGIGGFGGVRLRTTRAGPSRGFLDLLSSRSTTSGSRLEPVRHERWSPTARRDMELLSELEESLDSREENDDADGSDDGSDGDGGSLGCSTFPGLI